MSQMCAGGPTGDGDVSPRRYVYADRIDYTFGGYPSFMREKARTTPFDWPALSAALNTSNADASGGALKPLNSPEHKAKKRRT